MTLMKLNRTLLSSFLGIVLLSCNGGTSEEEITICNCINNFEKRCEQLNKKLEDTNTITNNDLDKKCSELLNKIERTNDKEKLKYSAEADDCFK